MAAVSVCTSNSHVRGPYFFQGTVYSNWCWPIHRIRQTRDMYTWLVLHYISLCLCSDWLYPSHPGLLQLASQLLFTIVSILVKTPCRIWANRSYFRPNDINPTNKTLKIREHIIWNTLPFGFAASTSIRGSSHNRNKSNKFDAVAVFGGTDSICFRCRR